MGKNMIWYSIKEKPFEISGLAWFEKEGIYRRLPEKPDYKISESVNTLADCTAGVQLRFKTNSAILRIKGRLLNPSGRMPHMPSTGEGGFDCYIGNFGKMKYLTTTKFPVRSKNFEFTFFEFKERKKRDITLYFPLYNGVKEVFIGLEKNANLLPPEPFKRKGRIIVYGTSITQGGCASRPGMAYTNILSRKLGIEFINLGFSGSGKGEPEMAKIITQIENPLCYVLDYEPNCMGLKYYRKTLPQFIKILRKKSKNIPILVISHIPVAAENFDSEVKKNQTDRKEFEMGLIKKLRKEGDKKLYFKDGYELLGKDFHECTVDGVHPNDLGFMRMANSLTPVFKKILKL